MKAFMPDILTQNDFNKKFNTLYLWEKDNYWYDNLIQEYDQQSLLKL